MPKSPSGSERDRRVATFMEALEGALNRHGMAPPGSGVVVAVSGGPDSVALLHGLHRLAPGRSLRLSVAHLHHGLRGAAADGDARRVDRLAQGLALPCDIGRVDTAAEARRRRESLEAAGRRLRYRFLRATAARRDFRRVALGHQRNDNAELVLMNLLRGSGPLGLAGMPPVREGLFIRPLLDVDRSAVMDFLDAIGAEHGEDETNHRLDHRRNWVRRVLLPLLAAEANPAVVDALNRTAAIARAEEEWLGPLVEGLLEGALRACDTDRVVLDRAALSALAPAARRRVLRAAVGRLRPNLHRLALVHVDAAAALADRPDRTRRLHLPHRLQVIGTATRIEIRRLPHSLRRPVPATPPAFRYEMAAPGRLDLPELSMVLEAERRPPAHPGGLPAGQWTAFFDMDAVGFPLVVRSAVPGDRFRPSGAGGRRKVARFLIDQKVPRHRRWRFPVVESRGRIIWLAGQRIAAAVEAPVTASMTLAVTFRPAAGAAAAPPHPRKESAE